MFNRDECVSFDGDVITRECVCTSHAVNLSPEHTRAVAFVYTSSFLSTIAARKRSTSFDSKGLTLGVA